MTVKLWEVFEVYGDPTDNFGIERVNDETKYLQCTEEELKEMIKDHENSSKLSLLEDAKTALTKAKNKIIDHEQSPRDKGHKKKSKALAENLTTAFLALSDIQKNPPIKTTFYYKEVVLSTTLK